MTDTLKKTDIHQDITDRIVAAIEAGAGEFHMPWHTDAARQLPQNVASNNFYRGINIMSLWIAQTELEYTSNLWGTYKQWQACGAQVRRGEKSSLVVFYKEVRRNEPTESGEVEAIKTLVAKASSVFNADQVDGYEPATATPLVDQTLLLDRAEDFVQRTGATIEHGGSQAYYRSTTDSIHLPARERFSGTATSTATESYYSVLLHELTHWTAPEHRLGRNLKNRFGSEAYAMEEMIAELGAAFLCAQLGIANEPRLDHAAYLSQWLQVLKSDKKALFTAASKASQAVDYLTGLQSPTDRAA